MGAGVGVWGWGRGALGRGARCMRRRGACSIAAGASEPLCLTPPARRPFTPPPPAYTEKSPVVDVKDVIKGLLRHKVATAPKAKARKA